MHMIKFNDIWEQKLFPLLIVRGWKYRRGGENIVTIFSPRGEDIVGVKISSHTGLEHDTEQPEGCSPLKIKGPCFCKHWAI